jgi:hypothetical protein
MLDVSRHDVVAPRSMTSRARRLLNRSFWSERRSLALSVALAIIVIAPIVVLALDGFGRDWYPAGDWAMTELRVLDSGTWETPLVGPYSRFGWNHPGPLMFWLYAIPYRILGESSSSMVLTAGLVNAVALGGMLAFAWRRGRLALVTITAVALAFLLSAFDASLLRDPWNPWVTVLPFGLLIVAVWSATERDGPALLVAVVVGSFLVQSHVGFAPLVGGLLAWAVVLAWFRGHDRRLLLWAAVVLAVCWLPVLVDALFGSGNMSRLIDHFTTDSDPAGLSAGLEMAARQMGHEAPWMGGEEPINAFGGALMGRSSSALLWPLVLFGAAMGLAAYRRAFDAVRFQATVALTALLGVFTVSRISEDVFDYLVRWWWPIAALWWVAAAWSVWSVLAGAWPRASRVAAIPAVVVAGFTAWTLMAGVVDARDESRMPIDDWHQTLDAVAARTVDEAPRGEPVLLRSSGPLAGWLEDALSVQLDKAGVDVRVLDAGINPYKFGAHRLAGPGEAETAVWVVTGPDVERAAVQPGWRPVAHHDPLTPEERGTADDLDAYLLERFGAGGRTEEVEAIEAGLPVPFVDGIPGVTEEHLALRDHLRARGVRVAVFLADAPDDPFSGSAP